MRDTMIVVTIYAFKRSLIGLPAGLLNVSASILTLR